MAVHLHLAHTEARAPLLPFFLSLSIVPHSRVTLLKQNQKQLMESKPSSPAHPAQRATSLPQGLSCRSSLTKHFTQVTCRASSLPPSRFKPRVSSQTDCPHPSLPPPLDSDTTTLNSMHTLWVPLINTWHCVWFPV